MNPQLKTPPLTLAYTHIKDPDDVQAHEEITARAVELAKAFVRRSECMGFKGKKRDEFALEFFSGPRP